MWDHWYHCFGLLVKSTLGFWHASMPASNGFLRFTFGATPDDLLVASMAANLFCSMYLYTFEQALVELELRIVCAARRRSNLQILPHIILKQTFINLGRTVCRSNLLIIFEWYFTFYAFFCVTYFTWGWRNCRYKRLHVNYCISLDVNMQFIFVLIRAKKGWVFKSLSMYYSLQVAK